jgi:hypothetical protein
MKFCFYKTLKWRSGEGEYAAPRTQIGMAGASFFALQAEHDRGHAVLHRVLDV